MDAKAAVIRSFIEDLCASRWPLPRSVGENFFADPNRSVSVAIRAGSVAFQF